MKNQLRTNQWFTLLFLAGMSYLAIYSCEIAPPDNSRAAQAQRGKQHFQQDCAPCHGMDAKGKQIDSLKVQPADLTKLKRSYNSKEFPIASVARVIDGRNVIAAHRTRDMPIWGQVYKEQEGLEEGELKGRLGELIAYLMTIQDDGY